jgi:hypothetical protein
MEAVRATYRFEIEDGGDWTLSVNEGIATVRETRSDDSAPSCTLRGSDMDMALVLRGGRNLLTAALQGRIQVEGDLSAAAWLNDLLFAFQSDSRNLAQEGRPHER